jgi:hypothetical protein
MAPRLSAGDKGIAAVDTSTVVDGRIAAKAPRLYALPEVMCRVVDRRSRASPPSVCLVGLDVMGQRQDNNRIIDLPRIMLAPHRASSRFERQAHLSCYAQDGYSALTDCSD